MFEGTPPKSYPFGFPLKQPRKFETGTLKAIARHDPEVQKGPGLHGGLITCVFLNWPTGTNNNRCTDMSQHSHYFWCRLARPGMLGCKLDPCMCSDVVSGQGEARHRCHELRGQTCQRCSSNSIANSGSGHSRFPNFSSRGPKPALHREQGGPASLPSSNL